MMRVTPLVMKAYGFKAQAFERTAVRPGETQRKFLLSHLFRNRHTEFGKEYNFTSLKTVKDYQSRIPFGDYETHRPYIERLMRGHRNVLTVDTPILFGVTSGTTGTPKHIPVTEPSRRKKKELMDIWTYYILKDHPGIFDGKILAIVSPECEGVTTCRVPFGAESGHAYKNMPDIVKNIYALPYEVFEIKDYDAKYYTILRLSMEQDIRVIAALNPSTIVLLCARIKRVWRRAVEDIARGTLDEELTMRYDIRKKIESTLTPNPEQARRLEKRARARGGTPLPADLWPSLQVLACWKGGSAGTYLPQLRTHFGESMPIRDFGYLSSEARCSVPVSDRGCAGILATTSNFYEFVDAGECPSERSKFLLAEELEEGKRYYILLTTPGGLYRYHIDDIVKVTGFFRNTPMIEFCQKGSMVCSVTGEKLYEAQVSEAVTRAIQGFDIELFCFSACLEWAHTPRYCFLVEFCECTPDRETSQRLLKAIESELGRLNIEYGVKRRSQRLGTPALKILRNGSFERYRSMRVREGGNDGQFKIPRLHDNTDMLRYFEIEDSIEL